MYTDDASLESLKARLVVNPATGEQDYFRLQARLVRAFGPEAGILARQLIFWTGRSMLDGGWLWKTREELRSEIGLGNRSQQKARAILRGDKAYAGRAVTVLYEHQPSRRKPMCFRLDLANLAEFLESEEKPE